MISSVQADAFIETPAVSGLVVRKAVMPEE